MDLKQPRRQEQGERQKTVGLFEQSNNCARESCFWFFLLYRHECFTGKYTTRKIHKNYIRDPSGLFSIISHVSLSMT